MGTLRDKAHTGGGNKTLPPLDEEEPLVCLTERSLRELAKRIAASNGDARICHGKSGGRRTPSNYSTSSTGTSRYAELRYTKFKIDGFPGVKHAVFVNDGLTLSPTVLGKVFTALGCEVPSMVLKGTGSIRHPSTLSTPQLRRTKAFQQLMQEVGGNTERNSRKMQSKHFMQSFLEAHIEPWASWCNSLSSAGQCNYSPVTQNEEEEENGEEGAQETAEMVQMVNQVFERKLVSMMAAVATAASQVNAWTFSGPKLSGFELLLQQCLDSGMIPETHVFRFVVGHLQDRAYMQSDASASLMKQLWGNSRPMSAEIVKGAQVVLLPGDLWNPKKNTMHADFAKHGFNHWSFDSYADNSVRGHPVAQWLWPHGNLFLLFYREAAPGEVDWDFMTKSELDEKIIPFTPEMLAPLGCVVVGGNEKYVKRRMMQAMQMATPLILVDNLHGPSKQVCSFVRIMHRLWDGVPLVTCRPFLTDGALTRLGGSPSREDVVKEMAPSKVLRHVEDEFDGSALHEGEMLTLADVVILLDLVSKRPQAFKETVCLVDPLQPSVLLPKTSRLESVLTCLYASAKEPKDLAIHRSLTLRGWRLHRNLAIKARKLHLLGMLVVAATALMILLTSALAVWMVLVRLETQRHAEVYYNISVPLTPATWICMSFTRTETMRVMHQSLVVLPLSALLLTTLHSHFQLADRWAKAHMAATLMVSEIYYFLGNVGPYSGATQQHAQKRFTERLRRLVGQVSVAGVHEEDWFNDTADDFPRDLEELEEHVNSFVYSSQTERWAQRLLQDLLATAGLSLARTLWTALTKEAGDPKDYAAELSTEAYMELRIFRLRGYYLKWLKALTGRRVVLNTALVLCLSVVSLCLICWALIDVNVVSSGLCLMIPVSVAAVTFLMTLMQSVAPPATIAALENALAALDGLDLRWQELIIRKKRSDKANAALFIDTAEEVWQSVATAFCGTTIMPDDQMDAPEQEKVSGSFS